MNAPLSNRLQQARERLFVGRAAQLDPFARALELEAWPRAVWHLHGLGGIGKTTLLRQWKRQAQEAGALVVSLDGRDFEPTPGAFCQCLRAALIEISQTEIASPATPQSLCEALAQMPRRVVLQIDTLELLVPLDPFWREKFLPLLPQNAVLLLAGRDELPLAWRGDAALWSEVESFNLAALSPLESQIYLEKRGIQAPFWAQLLSWTHGHPLALSLAADVWQQQAGTLGFAKPNAPDQTESTPKPGAGDGDARAAIGASAATNSTTARASGQTDGSLGETNGAGAAPSSPELVGPRDLPELVGPLLEHLMREVPTPAHRAAVEACAIVRALTQELLAEMLADLPGAGWPGVEAQAPDFGAIFEWLRALSMVQSHRYGVFPHDIARELLVADLRFRTPDWHGELHRRAREYYLRRMENLSGPEQERAILDCIYLHRLSPVVAPYLRWNDSGLSLETARPDDFPALLAMIEAHEGAASRDLAQAHFAAQPEGAIVVRRSNGQAQGFIFQLALERATPEILVRDEGARQAHEWLRAQAPLRAGEVATMFRWWMDRDSYQNVGATQSLIFVQAVRHYITTPHLAFSFLTCAAPDFWESGFAYADLTRLPELDFRSGNQPLFVFGHDWRARPVLSWLELLSQREMQTVAPAIEPSPLAAGESFRVLDEAQWLAATHEALRCGGEIASLRANSLLDTALVQRHARHLAKQKPGATNGANNSAPTLDERAVALRVLLGEAIEALGAAPRSAKSHRALELCFGRAALTQEAAALAMDVSHSSLRRYLGTGIAQVADALREREQATKSAGAATSGRDSSGAGWF